MRPVNDERIEDDEYLDALRGRLSEGGKDDVSWAWTFSMSTLYDLKPLTLTPTHQEALHDTQHLLTGDIKVPPHLLPQKGNLHAE